MCPPQRANNNATTTSHGNTHIANTHNHPITRMAAGCASGSHEHDDNATLRGMCASKCGRSLRRRHKGRVCGCMRPETSPNCAAHTLLRCNSARACRAARTPARTCAQTCEPRHACVCAHTPMRAHTCVRRHKTAHCAAHACGAASTGVVARSCAELCVRTHISRHVRRHVCRHPKRTCA